jgi:hypothetical protein
MGLTASLGVLRPDRNHRPGDGTCSERPLSAAPEPVIFSFCYLAAVAFSISNGVPSTVVNQR